jgi:hypothetical protein
MRTVSKASELVIEPPPAAAAALTTTNAVQSV